MILLPGTLFHIALVTLIRDSLIKHKILTEDELTEFYAGNLLPDLAMEKDKVHYQKNTEAEGLLEPDVYLAKQQYFKDDPILLGAYAHILLDKFFIDNGLLYWFVFHNMKVFKKDDGRILTYKEFFGERGIYGDYTKMNHLLIRDGYVTDEILDRIPEYIPQTGIPELDNRKSITWRQEDNGHLSKKDVEVYGLLDYDEMICLLEKSAEEILQELYVIKNGKTF